MMKALLLAGVAAIGWSGAANATFLFSIAEVGSNVVVTGSGSLNLVGASFEAVTGITGAVIEAGEPLIANGSVSPTYNMDLYTAPVVSSSGGFGTASTGADSGSGDKVFLAFRQASRPPNYYEFAVPGGYVSGTPLMEISTYLNSTFTSLGLVPGTYIYSYGSPSSAVDEFVVQIGSAATAVPEPASFALLGLGIAGGVAARRRRGD